MLSLHQTNRVTFTVSVFGTAATPTVRVLVGETPALTFSAVKLAGNEYEALLDLPETFKPGPHPFKIEVLINGKLFTPIQTAISVEGEESVAPPAPIAAPAPEPVPEPAPELPRVDAVVGVTQPVAEDPAPAPVKPKIEIASLMKELTKNPPIKEEAPVELKISAAPKLKTLEGTAKKKPAPRKKAPTTPTVAPAPVTVSMLKIAEEADRREVKRPAAPQQAPTAPILEMNTEIPVAFTRDDIVYK